MMQYSVVQKKKKQNKQNKQTNKQEQVTHVLSQHELALEFWEISDKTFDSKFNNLSSIPWHGRTFCS